MTSDAYDGLGNMTYQAVYATSLSPSPYASETFQYDGDGNLTSQLDYGGDVTSSSYADGNMTQQVVYDADNSSYYTQSWGYDGDNNLTFQVDVQGFTTSSTYSNDELVTQMVSNPGGAVETQTFAYDDAGNVTQQYESVQRQQLCGDRLAV